MEELKGKAIDNLALASTYKVFTVYRYKGRWLDDESPKSFTRHMETERAAKDAMNAIKI